MELKNIKLGQDNLPSNFFKYLQDIKRVDVNERKDTVGTELIL